MIEYVSPRKVVLLHPVREPEKFNRLVASMRAEGWTGRPALALDMGDHLQALTGSHRIAAAIEADLETIPVYVISAADHVCGDDGNCEICGPECWVAAALEGRDFETNKQALIWTIISPEGLSCEVRNLRLWVKQNAKILPGTPEQAYAGFMQIKRCILGKTKRAVTQWKGWQLVDWRKPD